MYFVTIKLQKAHRPRKIFMTEVCSTQKTRCTSASRGVILHLQSVEEICIQNCRKVSHVSHIFGL